MKIYGAGLAGLLAANVFRKSDPVVYESQASLPNNHTALLRHREVKIAEATSIPFRKVRVTKAINYKGKQFTEPSIPLSNMYSKKVTGAYTPRSIINMDPVDRYIAPPDFIQKLAVGVNIEFGKSITKEDIANNSQPSISTIPMPTIWNMMYPDLGMPNFGFRDITVVTANIDCECDLYQTVYYANPELSLYRMSITGNKVIAEFMFTPDFDMPRHGVRDERDYILHFLELDFGITGVDLCNIKTNKNKYGKIKDIDQAIRKRFMLKLTEDHSVYSLGRFATWRNILLDDVYDDCLVIDKLINSNGYLPKR